MTKGRNFLSSRVRRKASLAGGGRAPARAPPVLCEPLECRTLLAAAPVGAEFKANVYTAGDQSSGDVATDANGNSVVVWHSALQDGSGTGVYAQRFDSEGTPLGGEFMVNSHTAGSQWFPTVAMGAGGDFVVAWESTNQ